jgi:hypothetical protein
MTKKSTLINFFSSEPPRISAAELNRMSQPERLETIRNSHGKAKYEMLLNATDGGKLTPMLHPQEIYLTISEIGPAFASELLLMASTEQITTLIDLDCWEEDHIDPKTTLEWLSLLLETGPIKVSQTISEMEPELFALILKSFIRVVAGPEAYDTDDDIGNANRLEGLYDIDYRDDEAAKIVGGLLKALQLEDEQAWIQLLELVRAELDSVLEEEVYQSRNNRLSDFGFMSPAEARSIYATVDPATFSPATGKQFDLESEGIQNPLPLLRLAQPGGILAEVLGAGIDHNLATELCLLANRKMAADLVNIGDQESVTMSLSQLYASLNLGLEHLASHDADRATQLFRDCYLQQIFQVGHSLVKTLADRAKALLATPAGKLLDGPYRRFVDSLQQNPPELFCGIRVGDPQQPEEIQTLKQLGYIESVLQQIELQQKIYSDLLSLDLDQPQPFDLTGCNIETETDLTLSDLFLTALANQLLGGDFTPQPIADCELTTLHRLLVHDTKLNPQLIEQVRNQLEDQLPGASIFGDYCLEIWQEEFCQLEESEIDPRYLSGLIIRLSE